MTQLKDCSVESRKQAGYLAIPGSEILSGWSAIPKLPTPPCSDRSPEVGLREVIEKNQSRSFRTAPTIFACGAASSTGETPGRGGVVLLGLQTRFANFLAGLATLATQ